MWGWPPHSPKSCLLPASHVLAELDGTGMDGTVSADGPQPYLARGPDSAEAYTDRMG